MVDYVSLVVSHAVLLIAFWRLMLRDDLDVEPPRAPAPESADEREERPSRKPLRRA